MAKILILGAGAMGSAFSVPSLERRHEVIIAGTHLEDAFIDDCLLYTSPSPRDS